MRLIFEGILARAQTRYRMEVCDFVFLSNHYHLLLIPRSAKQLASFMNFVNSNLAREAGRANGWRDRFWSKRYEQIPVTDEEAAQVSRLRYVLSHGCKEGLVASPRDWPGASSVRARLIGEPVRGRWIDRTALYLARQRGLDCGPDEFTEETAIVLSPLPCWAHLDKEMYRQRYAELVADIEANTLQLAAATGREPAGAAYVTRQDPQLRPNRLKKTSAPIVHAASRACRQQFRESYRLFVTAYRSAAEKLRAGWRQVQFPAGSFPPALPFVPMRS